MESTALPLYTVTVQWCAARGCGGLCPSPGYRDLDFKELERSCPAKSLDSETLEPKSRFGGTCAGLLGQKHETRGVSEDTSRVINSVAGCAANSLTGPEE